ncbi:MAG: Crp/Fnr family transcriptional regulator [bacterium]
MAVDPTLLQQFKLYRGLGTEALGALAQVAVVKKLRKGQRLWRLGDKTDGYYSIMTGLAKSFRETPDGREQVLCLTGPGQQIGTMAVLSDATFPCHATVLESGEFLFFPKAGFREAIRLHHDLAMQLLSGLASQCNVLANKVEDLSLHDAETRLRNYLLSLPVKGTDDAGQAVVNLPVSKTTLASMLGLSRETLSRTFAGLQHRHWIDLDGRRITLLDIAALESGDLLVEAISTH